MTDTSLTDMAVGKHMTKPSSRRPRAAVAAGLTFAAVMALGVPLLADVPTPPTANEPAAPTVAPEAESSVDAPAPRRPMTEPNDASRDNATAIQVERRFNDLRRELLDDQARTVDWWLAATAIFLTLFAVVVAIAGFVSFQRFREIDAEARGNVDKARTHAEEVEKLAESITVMHDRAKSQFEGITAETAVTEPDKTDEAMRSIQADPSASLIDQAIAAAVLLQRQGNTGEAIEKWRVVANIADGIDTALGTQAWFSVGYLHGEESRSLEAIDAYDRAIRLKPDMAEAFYNRGIAKDNLGRHEDAIADYDEAIYLNPNLAEAYNNRGNAKDNLSRHEDAIADYDEAIRLKPDYAVAYNNRGTVKDNLGRHQEAIADYDEAIRLSPNLAEAYNNRGSAKNNLGRHQEAIADHDEAIRLKPDYAIACYDRAKARFGLGHKDEARRDLETALELARAAGDEATADKVRRAIERFFGGGDP